MTATAESAYETYKKVLRDVLDIRGSAGTSVPAIARPSKLWEEQIDAFDYMLDATPSIVAKLRHHCFHVTRPRAREYWRSRVGHRESLKARLDALIGLGTAELLVPEAPDLGGFGYEIHGGLFNLDTVKFFEANVALQRVGVFDRLRQSSARQLVWEIGGGWGGFARQFKLLVPNLTWVITDFPELFLFSATYLGALLPEARILIYRGTQDQEALSRWQEFDFIFLPTVIPEGRPPARPTLTISLASLQDMTSAQVSFYAAAAASLGTEAFYSLNRDHLPDNRQLGSLRRELTSYFDLVEVPILDLDHSTALEVQQPLPALGSRKHDGKENSPYRHLFGVLKSHDRQSPGVHSGVSADDASVRVAIGMTLYNNCRHLPEAVSSLLEQTYTNFRLVLYDDCSTDKTEILAMRYERRDARITYVRGEKRLGMIGAWKRVFEIARKRYPKAEYFAWVSDHDYWAPDWLQVLLDRLETDPSLVMSYCHTTKMSPKGTPEAVVQPAFFDTSSCDDIEERWHLVCQSLVGAGNMVYGLMRSAALLRAGVFRRVLLPDRLLMAELALQGKFAQVPMALWYRRRGEPSTVARQRQTLFGPSGAPLHAYLPWWFVHAAVIVKVYSLKPRGTLKRGALPAFGLGVEYLRGQLQMLARKYKLRYRAVFRNVGTTP